LAEVHGCCCGFSLEFTLLYDSSKFSLRFHRPGQKLIPFEFEQNPILTRLGSSGPHLWRSSPGIVGGLGIFTQTLLSSAEEMVHPVLAAVRFLSLDSNESEKLKSPISRTESIRFIFVVNWFFFIGIGIDIGPFEPQGQSTSDTLTPPALPPSFTYQTRNGQFGFVERRHAARTEGSRYRRKKVSENG